MSKKKQVKDFYAVLDDIRKRHKTEAAKGTEFEQLTQMFLEHDSTYSDFFTKVTPWSTWSKKDDSDTGIDLVAEEPNGTLWAIQCKFWKSDASLDFQEISTFLAKAASLKMKMMLVYTGSSFSTHATKVLMKSDVRLVFADEMAASSIDWSGYPDKLKRSKPKDLRPHQVAALKNVRTGFKTSDRGRLVMACGTGKTLTALHIAEKEAGKAKTILYAVPSISLVMQSMREWSNNKNIPHRYLLVCSDPSTRDDASPLELPIPPTTDVRILGKELSQKSDRMTVVFSTYHSLPVVQKAMGNRKFDLIFADEAHRTTGTSQKTADADDKGDDSFFTMIHNIPAKKRLYMTATERLYSEAIRESVDRVVVSMDDEKIYGKRFHLLSFKEAVEKKLLTDFKVKVEMLPEEVVSKWAQQQMAEGSELNMSEDTRLAAVWDAIARPEKDKDALQRVIVFSNTIKKSQEFSGIERTKGGKFNLIVDIYNNIKHTGFNVSTRHIDGKSKALDRRQDIRWLANSHEEPNTCRILSNARCLSEGVDVPALDGIVFLESRKSKIDVVQSVGRVMRRAPKKDTGYVILPVALPAGKPYHESLNDGETFKVVWDVLRALRSHDESFAVEINKLILEHPNEHEQDGSDDSTSITNRLEVQGPPDLTAKFFGKLKSALVREVGDVNYYDSYGKEIGKAANTIEKRISASVKNCPKTKNVVNSFNKSLRKVVSESIGEKETIQVISQHMVLSRVFDRLFDGKFRTGNPVASEFEKVVQKLNMPDITSDLEEFYLQVDEEMDQVSTRQGRQAFIKKIYGNFFAAVDKKGAEKHGVVYTPIECIDFIIHSVEALLKSNFNKGLKTPGIKILEPFAGTGTFITRLLESGLIDKTLEQKYHEDISANELILLAHYVATTNIETTYKSLVGDKYHPFPGMAYTDTLNINPLHLTKPEKSRRQSKVNVDLPELDKRVKKQMGLKIDVIIGNPPYSAGQKSFDDENPNITYPEIDERIEATYGKYVTGKSKEKLRDSYIRSIRWMSDRISDCGVIGIITNGSFMRSESTSGMRAALVEEFDEIWCLDLRGNQRTKGEESKKEGGKIFGSGSRAPVAITFLVKKPKPKSGKKTPAKVYYKDIGDYLNTSAKITKLADWKSIEGIDDWDELAPDRHNDWLDQRNDDFYDYVPISNKDVKAGKTTYGIFKEYAMGVNSARDVWVYNSSVKNLKNNMQLHIDYYNKMNPKKIKIDPKKGKWDNSLTKKRIKHGNQKYNFSKIRKGAYRPFFKQNLYYDHVFNFTQTRVSSFLPTTSSRNKIICLSMSGPFSVLITDASPDMHFVATNQCFPIKIFDGDSDKSNILDSTLIDFKNHYKNNNIVKDDIFYYVYAMLHHPGYRIKFKNALTRDLPHIPMAPDFKKFTDAGKKLALLHIGYESCKRYSIKPKFKPSDKFTKLMWGRKYTVENGHQKSIIDKTVVKLDGKILYEKLPKTKYEVNGRSPLGWVLDRYQITQDDDSGIINNPCTGIDICAIIERAIYVATESDKIIREFPNEFEPINWKPKKQGLDAFTNMPKSNIKNAGKNDIGVRFHSISSASCPKCNNIAKGRKQIEKRFGYRKVNGKIKPQSWCVNCRRRK